MITEAWEAGRAVLAALLVWVAGLSILAGMTVAGLAIGVRAVWRGLCAAVAASRALRALRTAEPAPDASQARVWLRAARVSPTDTAATGPSRPHSPRQSAAQRHGGGFPAPTAPRPATGRTEEIA